MIHPQRPLYDRVIVQRLEEKSKSRIEVVSNDKPMRARVIAVGPGKRENRLPGGFAGEGDLIPLSVKPGDIVLIGKYSGTVYEERGADFKTTEYVIVREEDILTVFEKEATK